MAHAPAEPAASRGAWRTCAICRRRAPLVSVLGLTSGAGQLWLTRVGGQAVAFSLLPQHLASVAESSDNAAPRDGSAWPDFAAGAGLLSVKLPSIRAVGDGLPLARLGKRQHVCPARRCLANWAKRQGQPPSAADWVAQVALTTVTDLAAARSAGLRRRRIDVAGDGLLVALHGVRDSLLGHGAGAAPSGKLGQERRSAGRHHASATDRKRGPPGPRE